MSKRGIEAPGWVGVAAFSLWLIADSATQMLTTGDLSRLRQCGGGDCNWLFKDPSRNRSRQWCVMEQCGNVAKVRRFRSRSRKSTKGREA